MDIDILRRTAYAARDYLINAEYHYAHISYQLAKTSEVIVNEDSVSLIITAPTYDVDRYQKDGVMVYTNEGSYANENDLTGGFSGEHVGYIERIIVSGIEFFLEEKGIEKTEVDIIVWN